MKYISTRGQTEPMSFSEAVMTGLARDGGLLLPESFPQVADKLAEWRSLSYCDLAFEVMKPFVDIPDADLRDLVDRSYATFRDPAVTPLKRVGDVHILELFHGPTLAFKDVALQFLGNLFEYQLERTQSHLNIVAATSGDTGSAAIYGVRGKERINIFVMHPKGRTSQIQERQMTTVLDANVFNLAVDGTFDDCQGILKQLFNDLSFRDRYCLGAVNSINWARVLAQVVYYFYATLQLGKSDGAETVRFCVPTGNFGDIFAGYVAARMGLPIGKLVLATNENDILTRFFTTGVYSQGSVNPTLSPSMDIQVASNFERYLYYHLNEDCSGVCAHMEAFAKGDGIRVPLRGGQVDPLFAAGTGTTADTLAAIKSCYADEGYLLDPHTAVGYHVAQQHLNADEPMVCLATAHPAKFSDAITQAIGEDLAHHPLLDALAGKPSRCEDMTADVDQLKAQVLKHVS
ncbi:MAG: threonine synthase [Verrucomicrobia bacterium]|nr:threonine synthase [Verrucomicrobiota bacterium]